MSMFLKSKKTRNLEKKGLIGSRKRQKQEETLSHAAEKSSPVAYSILVLLWCATVTILVLPKSKRPFSSLVPNQISSYTIYADFDFSLEDVDKTELDKATAKSNVPLVYRCAPDIMESVLEKSRTSLDAIASPSKSDATKNNGIEPQSSSTEAFLKDFSPEAKSLLALIARDPNQRQRYLEHIKTELIRGIISPEAKSSHKFGQTIRIVDAKGRIRQSQLIKNIPVPTDAAINIAESMTKNYSPTNRDVLKGALRKLAANSLRGNLIYDQEATAKNKTEAAANVPPVIVEIAKGDVLVRKGQVVKRGDIAILEAYMKELDRREGLKNFWRNLINSAVICLVLIASLGVYVRHIHPEVLESNQKIALVGTVIILSSALVYATIEAYNSFSPDLSLRPQYMMVVIPTGLAAILLSVLIGLRIALFAGLFVSIIAALQMDDAYRLIVDGFVVSCVAGYAVRSARNYKDYFIRAALAVCLTTILVNFRQFWSVTESLDVLTWTLGLASLNGIITAIAALILVFLLETLFQVSTDMSLLTLCDYNHPLLKRLQLEAPGTYHHSLMVSTLAEHAAEAIGANPIKARVCALFHDIGKLSQPEYFTENSSGEKDKHSELRPRMSSLVILNHVKEGIDMAIKYKLKKVIRDAIQRHHGTDLVQFFYKRAVEANRDKETHVEEQEYRYSGPLPREKEIVLVSLADACEAASRSLQKPSPAKVEALVWEIMRKRIRNGQLDDADLTFGELAKVRRNFIKTLSTMLHGRISYSMKDEDDDEDDLFKSAKDLAESPQKATSRSI